jgi:acetyl esterase/lipase
MTALSVVLHSSPEEMPAFIAPIYGPMVAVQVPAAAPPMFVGLAFDDPLFGRQGFGLVESWQRANKPVELHVYQKGGHGFGLGNQGTTTIGWPQSFVNWLETNKLLDKH